MARRGVPAFFFQDITPSLFHAIATPYFHYAFCSPPSLIDIASLILLLIFHYFSLSFSSFD